MSENLDLVRSIYAGWERGDFGSTEWADPEIECIFPDGPSPGSWKGVAGMAEANRDFLSAWEEFRFEGTEFRELDGARILALFNRSGRGRASGVQLGQMRSQGAGLFEVHGSRVTRMILYAEREHALADLGLDE
jgi:hypothetical protein